jgi:hypothetical protein
LGDNLFWAVFLIAAVAQTLGQRFSTVKVCVFILTKKWAGLHFGDFLQNTSDHPDLGPDSPTKIYQYNHPVYLPSGIVSA